MVNGKHEDFFPMKYTDACAELHRVLVTEGADTIRISTVQRRFKLGFNEAYDLLAFLEQRDCGGYLEDGVRSAVNLETLLELIDREISMNRQVFLDVETTGIDPAEGHRVIEIGGLEMVDERPTGKTFHQYLNPEREIDAEAFAVHGLSNEFLADKPVFADVAQDFLGLLQDAELVVFNAPFDLGFLNHELQRFDESLDNIEDMCRIIDALAVAREMFPGQRNSLDALYERFDLETQHTSEGALLECEILAHVYQAMMKTNRGTET